ncbi:VOC family protein [Sinomonas atrocyanea]|jgi:catechol 2,3-dioxygenase-like lactoylglutathione lyase family enzyme|uniref:VOC family protein n=1 Tax=Sinomonas atrocyanea TaxID=37927 RepID=UPI0028625F1E|nr:VOC family protein [Sinomonas atrocyanea]MDR6622549.1 catechol 2,3-dioxygenase-like lactoylglutathione lyase family enzyme [Sinomonas atrocyanea]
MFQPTASFSSFSVDDVEKARAFYGGTLGFDVADQMGGLLVTVPGGQTVFAYPKPDHVPATFTVLNFEVADLDAAIAEIEGLGLHLEHYPSTPEMPVDGRGVLRDPDSGMGIAWFTDPAGNVLSVVTRAAAGAGQP